MWTADNVLGAIAAALVLLAFCMRTMPALRIVALASNVVFIAYALRLDLLPILALHSILLPINVVGLCRSVTVKPIAIGNSVDPCPCQTEVSAATRG
jgi:hypothetical protein